MFSSSSVPQGTVLFMDDRKSTSVFLKLGSFRELTSWIRAVGNFVIAVRQQRLKVEHRNGN